MKVLFLKTTWKYQNELFDDDNLQKEWIGFIYLMTHLPSGKRYIGRKLLTVAGQYQKNKKIYKIRKESDWKTYYSSCPEILKMIEAGEPLENFEREILVFAPGRAILNYLEEKFQQVLGVLESEDWYNTNIRSKFYKRHILGKINTFHVNNVLKDLMRIDQASQTSSTYN